MAKFLFNSRGTAMLEFAVMLPVFLAVVLGFFNLVLLLHNDIVAQEAADEAARTAGVTADERLAERRALEVLEWGGLGGRSRVDVAMPPSYSDRLDISVEYETPLVAPGIGAFVGGKPWDDTVELEARSSRIFEYQHRVRPEYGSPRPGDCVGYWCKGGSDW